MPEDDRYVEIGSGPAVILSHGTLMDHTMFAPQLDALSDDYRVVAFNHRARTDRWKGPYSLEDLAEECRELLDALGIERCVLGGMSMGGFMAIPFALRYPERLDGLILISTMAGAYMEDELAQNERELESLLKQPYVSRSFAEWERDLVMGDTTKRENPELVEAWIARWMSRRSESVYWEFMSWMRKPDMTRRLAEIQTPVLVIHGTEDAVLPLARGRAMADNIPNVRFVPIERAGHTVTIEAPDAVSRAVREFLDEIHGA